MTLLAGTMYDPAVAVLAATTTLTKMTALDTTHLRLTFKCPANGIVRVRLQTNVSGSTAWPRILLGVLDGVTVRGRGPTIGSGMTDNLATNYMPFESDFLVTGLTAGQSYTWDAAMSVDNVQSATNAKWGGPNDTAGADAFGGFAFEVHDTIPLLAGTMYDPATAASLLGTSLTALTALDTTNLRLTFKVPPSGNVMWHFRASGGRGTSVWGQILLGVLEGATVRGRVAPQRGTPQTNTTTTVACHDASGVVTGLTPGASLTWDAAAAVQVVNGGTSIVQWGGPDDTTTQNAWGGALFEVWAV